MLLRQGPEHGLLHTMSRMSSMSDVWKKYLDVFDSIVERANKKGHILKVSTQLLKLFCMSNLFEGAQIQKTFFPTHDGNFVVGSHKQAEELSSLRRP